MHRPLAAILLAGALSSPAWSDNDDPARWYRYYNEKNQPTITDRITEEHIRRGYDALDKGMQLVRKVPPQRALTPAEAAAAKAARAAAAKRKEDDQQLLRLYSHPHDAEQNRDRQIEAVQVRIDFTNSALSRLKETRAKAAQQAAKLERTGRPVPTPLREEIGKHDQQIQQLQAELKARQAEQQRVREDFAPIIQRLQELTGTVAPAPAAAPGG